MRLAERISGSALPSLQHIYLKRCRSRAVKIIKTQLTPVTIFSVYCHLAGAQEHDGKNRETEEELLPSGHQAPKHKLCFIKHSQDPLLTVNIITFSSLLLYVHYHEQPVCTSLLFTLLFIKSQYTVFSFFCTSYVFCTSCCFFAHLFCTSYCLLHILLFFAHLIVIVLHFFYFIAHFTLISPFLTICMPLCYVTLYNLYSYYFALSTERTWFDYISLLIIPCITIMWQIKKPWTLSLHQHICISNLSMCVDTNLYNDMGMTGVLQG